MEITLYSHTPSGVMVYAVLRDMDQKDLYFWQAGLTGERMVYWVKYLNDKCKGAPICISLRQSARPVPHSGKDVVVG